MGTAIQAFDMSSSMLVAFKDSNGRSHLSVPPNDEDRTFCGYLTNLKYAYERLYPEHADTATLGDMIGANCSTDALRATWDEAYFMQDTPLEAAQEILHSPIFSQPRSSAGA